MIDYEELFKPIGEIYRQEGWEEGFRKGLKEAKRDMQIKIAKNLAKKGMPLKSISAITGLSRTDTVKILASSSTEQTHNEVSIKHRIPVND